MALLFLGKPDQNGIAIVTSIVYQTQYLDEETIALGIEVDEEVIPKASEPGKDTVLKFDVIKNEFVVGYVERPPSSDETLKKLQEENHQLGQQVSDLEIQLMQKDKEAEELGKQVSQLEIDALQKDKDTIAIAQQVSEMEIKQLKNDKDVAVLGQQVSSLEIELLKLQPTGGTN